jgi:hypothetical protein
MVEHICGRCGVNVTREGHRCAAEQPVREYWSPTTGRADVLTFRPFILAALWLSGYRGRVNVSSLICVYEEHGHNLAGMPWGDLVATISEALKISAIDPRTWRARTAGI